MYWRAFSLPLRGGFLEEALGALGAGASQSCLPEGSRSSWPGPCSEPSTYPLAGTSPLPGPLYREAKQRQFYMED